jgi:transglutaminase-like putative cysteine protease
VRVSTIAPGNPGIRETVRAMIRLMRVPSAEVDSRAERIRLSLPPGTQAPVTLAMAVYQWVQSHLTYTPDGEAPDAHPLELGQEGLRSPEYLLRGIANWGTDRGDCDDYVILMGALLLRLGVPVDVVLTSGRDDGEYDHVFLRAHTQPRRTYVLDGITGQPFGWHVPPDRVTASEVISV